MRRQVLLFCLVCAIFAVLLKDARGQFLEVWLAVKPAGNVTSADYDWAWAQFMMPWVALFLLVLAMTIIGGSVIDENRRLKRGHSSPLRFSILGFRLTIEKP